MTTPRFRPEDIPPFLTPRDLEWIPSQRNETPEQQAARDERRRHMLALAPLMDDELVQIAQDSPAQ